jgi:hypothetical protein
MTRSLTVPMRLAIAFGVSAPTLLANYYLVESGSRRIGLALFFLLFLVDLAILKPMTAGSMSPPTAKVRIPARSIWVVGGACFLGSLSLLMSGIGAHETWEVIGGTLGVLISGWSLSFTRKQVDDSRIA